MKHLDSEFTRVISDGQPMWLHGLTGRLVPVVAGGDGDEGASTQDGDEDPGDPTSDAADKPKVITMTSEQLAQRLARAKPADYDDLKAKAAKLDEIDAANKSELEKATDAVTAAEQRAVKAEADALRLRVAAKHGISDEDADLFLTGTDEETLTKQAERLGERTTTTKKNVVPKEGTTPPTPSGDAKREFLQTLTGRD